MNAHATVNLLTHLAPQPAAQADVVAMFGFMTAFFTLVFALYQRESRAFVLALAVGLGGLSVYGFLQGAWPLGFVNAYLSVSTYAKWRRPRKFVYVKPRVHITRPVVSPMRMTRMFGSN